MHMLLGMFETSLVNSLHDPSIYETSYCKQCLQEYLVLHSKIRSHDSAGFVNNNGHPSSADLSQMNLI